MELIPRITRAQAMDVLSSQANFAMPSRIPVDANQPYAKNLLAFLGLLVDPQKNLKIDLADEIVRSALLTRGGAIVHPQLAPPSPTPSPASGGGLGWGVAA